MAVRVTTNPPAIYGVGGSKVETQTDGSIHMVAANGQPVSTDDSKFRISTGPLEAPALTGIAVSAVTEGRIYFDSVANKWKVSENTGAYVNMLGSQATIASTTDVLIGDNAGNAVALSSGTGVKTALGVNVGSAGAFVVNGGALGTPSSGTLTNATGLPITGITSSTSAQLRTLLSDENGTGVALFDSATNPTFDGATINNGSLTISGNISAAAWTTSGLRLKGIAGTLTDTSSSGTVATAYTNKLGGNTIAASSATTFTNYISSYFSEPVAGTNVTLTNKYGLGADSLYVGTSNPLKVTSAGVLTATSPVLTTPDLGTPSALVVTNATGTASININGTVGATTPTTGAFTTLTNTGAATNSKSGAASTAALSLSGVPFAGTGTTSFPLLYVNDANATASTTLSTAGTYLGVNGDGTQDLINLLKDGASVFKIDSTGIITTAGGTIYVKAATSDLRFRANSSAAIRFDDSLGNLKMSVNNTGKIDFSGSTAIYNSGGVNIGSGSDPGVNNATIAGTLAVTGATTLTGAVTQGAKTTTYNNISTVSGGIPSEIATIDSTGLTANVAAATLYAVPASGAGLYRVSAYLVTTTAASVSSTMPNAQVVYTDSDSNTSVTLDVSPILGAAGLGQSGLLTANAVGTVFSGTVVVYIKASTTIQYQTVNYASTGAGMTYALRMKLEAL